MLSVLDLYLVSLGHHGFWWELFSLASAGLAVSLLVITIIAYRRHRLKRLFPLSIAFGLFVIKVGLLHLDSFFPAMQNELSLASVAAEVAMLSLIFVAMVKK